jgi:hypothetical protein
MSKIDMRLIQLWDRYRQGGYSSSTSFEDIEQEMRELYEELKEIFNEA